MKLFTFAAFFYSFNYQVIAQKKTCEIYEKNPFPIYSIIIPQLTNNSKGEIYVDIWSDGFYTDEKDAEHPSGTGTLSFQTKTGQRNFFAGTFKYGVPIGKIKHYDKDGNIIEYEFNDGKISNQKVISQESDLSEENIIMGAALIGKLLWEGGKWIFNNNESNGNGNSSKNINRSNSSNLYSTKDENDKVTVNIDNLILPHPEFKLYLFKSYESIYDEFKNRSDFSTKYSTDSLLVLVKRESYVISYSFTDGKCDAIFYTCLGEKNKDYINEIEKSSFFLKIMDDVWILSKSVYLNNLEKKIRIVFYTGDNGNDVISFLPYPSFPTVQIKPIIEWAEIPSGTFTMGSPTSEDGDETRHQVILSAFKMSKYEVTFEQYDAFCDAMGRKKPSDEGMGRGKHPVINVSWDDASEFAAWIGCRLPTEAEWEYACRAESKTPFNTGNNLTTNQANYNGNYPYNNNAKGKYRGKTLVVGSFAPNAWGLYDMHGNVWEWCSDWYDDYQTNAQTNPKGPSKGSTRVLRGGGWFSDADGCRSANRDDEFFAEDRDYKMGFRLVLNK